MGADPTTSPAISEVKNLPTQEKVPILVAEKAHPQNIFIDELNGPMKSKKRKSSRLFF